MRPDIQITLSTAVAALVPLTSGDPSVRHTVPLDQLVVRCRDHSETSAHLGSAALRVIEESVAGDLLATSRPVPPTLHALGILVISNDGAETVTLTSLDYAPAASATGTVRAASGDRRYVPLWLGEAYSAPRTQTSATTGNPLTGQPPAGRDSGPPATRPLIGAVDPAELTPWDAAYLDPADARNLRDHDADRLDLVMRPGEVAVIVVDHRALVRTLLPRPALLYPVLSYVVGTGCERAAHGRSAVQGAPAVRADQCSHAGPATHTTAMGLDTALYGSTPAWR